LEEKNGSLLYRPQDGEKSEKSMMTDEQIEKIASSIGNISATEAPPRKKKAKKNKKK
jgi:hypothetical protein